VQEVGAIGKAWPAGSAPGWRLALCAWALSAALGIGMERSSAQTPAPSALSTVLPAEDSLTPEIVQARLAEIEASSELEEGVKARALEHYRLAIDYLRAGQQWAEQAQRYSQARADAPIKLTTIKEELAKPPAEPKPEVPPDASLAQMEQWLAQREADLAVAQNEVTELDKERKRRADRKLKAPQDTAVAKQQLAEVQKELDAGALSDEPTAASAARLLHASCRKKSLQSEIEAYEQEILSYDARGESLTARQDLAARKALETEALVKAWRELVNERRRVESEQAAREAQQTRREAARKHAIVSRLAEENAQLADLRAQRRLADRIEQVTATLEKTRQTRARQTQRLADAQKNLAVAGLTQAVGLQLRAMRLELVDVAELRRDMRRLQAELTELQIDRIGWERRRDDLARLDVKVRDLMTEVDAGLPEQERAEIELAVRELLQSQRSYLESLIDDGESYVDQLAALDREQGELIRESTSYKQFIDEHVLWIQSAAVLGLSDVGEALRALRWLALPANWLEAVESLRDTTVSAPAQTALGLLIVLALLLFRLRFRRRVVYLGELARRASSRMMASTWECFLLTILLASPFPVFLRWLGWLLDAPLETAPFARALATGMRTTAGLLLAAELCRQVCRPMGLAEAHFGWGEAVAKALRRHISWLIAGATPLVLVVATLGAQDDAGFEEALGRVAFIAIHVLLSIFAYRVLRAQGDVLQEIQHRNPRGWPLRMRFLWYPLALALPLALAPLSVAGYYYTALHLAGRLQVTLLLVFAMAVANSTLLRWTLMARRRLAYEQYRKRRYAEGEVRPAEAATGEAAPGTFPSIDLGAISGQTRDLIHAFTAAGLFVFLYLAWVDVLPAFSRFHQVEVWTTVSSVTEQVRAADGTMNTVTVEKTVPITLADLLLALLVLLMTFIAGKNIPGLLEIAVLQRLPLEPSMRYAFSALSRYVLTLVGLVFAFGSIGISWSKVQWLAAAITVGLGFGLQEIFANFVSGLILLFERPLRVGDIVTVGNIEGKVTRIQMRATTIMDWDRRELVVPNKEFITSRLINWTLSDPVTRVVIPVGIAYGSDTELARGLLEQVARESPHVLSDPPPSAVFVGFGESSLDFQLRVFIATRDIWPDLMNGLHTGIDHAFRRAGIEIAFPQRDIHIRSINQPIPLTNESRVDQV